MLPGLLHSNSITFVLRDAGETNAMMPVMQQLEKEGVGYDILAQGTARQLLAGNHHLTPLPEDIATLSQSNPGLAAVANQRLMQAAQAKVCVTGMVSEWQKQWAQFFKQAGSRVIGYYDSFNIDLNPALNTANQFKGCLTDLVTTSRDTAANLWQQGFQNIPITPLGKPETPVTTNSAALAQWLGINPQQPTLLFVGDYGPGYAESLITFCQAVSHLHGLNILLALHPSSDGRLEQQILSQYNPQGSIKLVPKTIETHQLLPLTHTVVAHASNLATEAALQGKPIIFVGPTASTTEFNPLKSYQLAPQVNDAYVLAVSLQQALQKPTEQAVAQQVWISQRLGIPQQATQNISQFLKSKLI